MGVGPQAPQRVDLTESLAPPTRRGSIPGNLRRKIRNKAGDTCHYCGSFGSVFDHVIPVDQGGWTVEANLVFTCRRCNAQKLNRTPGQWKQLRIDRGLCWPPVDVTAAFTRLTASIPEDDAASLEPHFAEALQSAFPPLVELMEQFADDAYDEAPWSTEEWLAAVRPVVDLYVTHVLPAQKEG